MKVYGISSKVRRIGLILVGAVSGLSVLPSTAAKAATGCVANPMAVATRAPAATMLAGTLAPSLVAKLDGAARASFKAAAAPGAIVGVRTPAGTWTAAYGLADPVTRRPMSVGLHTRIGSVTKTFVGAMLLQLEQAGQLSLDDPIAKYLAGVPNGERITLRMLATMTSGLTSYTASPAFTDSYFADPHAVFTPDQILAAALKLPPSFSPGAKYQYSNTNTILLGLVIEKVTKQPIREVVRKQVFGPLKLASTSWPDQSPDIPQPYAHGFTIQSNGTPGKPVDATNWNPAWTWAAGEIVSTMDDLLVYGRAMGTGQGLLRPETQVARLTSFAPPHDTYGIAIGCADGWIGHTGELPGYNTMLFYDTRSDTTVVVQANSDIRSGDCKGEPVLAGDPREGACASPAERIFAGLAAALGHPFIRSGG